MKKTIQIAALLSLSLLLIQIPITSHADEIKTNVYVSHSGDDDSVGDTVVYKLKEEIRKSSALRLVPSKEQSDIIVGIVSLNGDSEKRQALMSVVWLLQNKTEKGVFDLYLTHSARLCGIKVTTDCAESLVASTDKIASEWAWMFSLPLAE